MNSVLLDKIEETPETDLLSGLPTDSVLPKRNLAKGVAPIKNRQVGRRKGMYRGLQELCDRGISEVDLRISDGAIRRISSRSNGSIANQ